MSRAGLDRSTLVVAGVATIGLIMAVLDTTIVNVALDTLSSDLHAPLGTIQWVSTAYLLSLAAVVPLSGWMTERFGSKRTWITSIVLFAFGSALCALATSAGELIAFRILQDLGGGMLMPVGFTLIAQSAGPRLAPSALADAQRRPARPNPTTSVRRPPNPRRPDVLRPARQVEPASDSSGETGKSRSGPTTAPARSDRLDARCLPRPPRKARSSRCTTVRRGAWARRRSAVGRTAEADARGALRGGHRERRSERRGAHARAARARGGIGVLPDDLVNPGEGRPVADAAVVAPRVVVLEPVCQGGAPRG
jgi:hypothetical protein